ncbi:MAG: PH domain-containing protein [Gemmatimonadetes bacterium]|nr:PH domain-containing protein [Gemmatimonadota bacterium]MYK42201.1 PH domain-containing protein [Gemmatimonadota bacterium]
MAEQFDLSTSPGAGQRLVFALLGAGQLILSTIAFQRGGFAYGLAVLAGGIAAFCAAAFFVHRLHRRFVWLGPEGVTVEEGLFGRQTLAWVEVEKVSLSPAATVFHAETGEDIVLHNAVNQPSDIAPFLARVRALVDEYELNG